jgi:ribosomal protein S18 acetylase RimI-like enzyme
VIRERGDVPFLHAAADNVSGIRLYEHLGFTLRRKILFAALRPAARGRSGSQHGGHAAVGAQ